MPWALPDYARSQLPMDNPTPAPEPTPPTPPAPGWGLGGFGQQAGDPLEEYNAEQRISQPATYGQDYVDAPTGSPRAQLEASRQGESQYGAIPAGIAAHPLGVAALATGGLIAPELMGIPTAAGAAALPEGAFAGAGMGAPGVGGVAKMLGISGAEQVISPLIPGFDKQPELLQSIESMIPFVAGGGGPLWLKAAEAIGGGAAGVYGRDIPVLGDIEKPIIGNVGSDVAMLGTGLLTGKFGKFIDEHSNNVKSILGPEEEPLDPAVAKLLGIDSAPREPSDIRVDLGKIQNQLSDIEKRARNVSKMSPADDKLYGELTNQKVALENELEQVNNPSIIDQAKNAEGNARHSPEDTKAAVQSDLDKVGYAQLSNASGIIVKNPDGTLSVKDIMGKVIDSANNLDELLAKGYDPHDAYKSSGDQTFVDVDQAVANRAYANVPVEELQNAKTELLKRMANMDEGNPAEIEAFNQLRQVQTELDVRNGEHSVLAESLKRVNDNLRKEGYGDISNTGAGDHVQIHPYSENLPPPAEGMTRIYRGSPNGEIFGNPTRTNPQFGRWFSTHLNLAKGYDRGNFSYADIPTSKINEWMEASGHIVIPEDVGISTNLTNTNTTEGKTITADPNAVPTGTSTNGPVPTTTTSALSATAKVLARIAVREDAMRSRAVPALEDMRDLRQLSNEVVTSDNPLTKLALARTGINPSIAMSDPVARLVVADTRARIESEGFVNNTLRAAWDANAQDTLMRSRLKIDREGLTEVFNNATNVKEKVPWQTAFEYPDRYKLKSPEAEELRRRFTDVVNRTKEYLQANGVTVRDTELAADQVYIPRKTFSIKDTEVPGFTDPTVRRIYKDAMESWSEGNRYAGPRETLQQHLQWAYRTVETTRLSDEVAAYGIKPSELVPEPIRITLEQKLKGKYDVDPQTGDRTLVEPGLRQARAEVKKEAADTQRLYQQMGTRDINTAKTQITAAKVALAKIKGELAGRAGLKTGKTSTPLSYGDRLREANARVNAAQNVLQDAMEFNAGIPRGSAGARRMVSDETMKKLDDATHEFNKARQDYSREMDAANSMKQGGGVANSAFFDPTVVSSRKALLDAERDLKNKVAAVKAAGGNTYKDPDIVAARKARNSLNESYQSTLRDTMKTAIDKPMQVDDWHNRFFPKEQYDDLENGLRKLAGNDTGFWGGAALQKATDFKRELSTGFDFAAPFIHGLPVLTRNPVVWARGVWHQYNDFLAPQNLGRYQTEHYDTMQKMARNELTSIGGDYYQASHNAITSEPHNTGKLGGVRNTIEQIHKQSFGRLAAGYEGAITAWRGGMWESLEPGWKGTEAELAQHVRNLTGGLDTRALGVTAGQRAFESNWVALSPKLLRSTISLMKDATQPTTPQGSAALRSLASLAGATVLGYVATGALLGKSEQDIKDGLNPMSGKRFLSHKIDGQWYGIGGQVRAIAQVMAGVYASAAPKYAFGHDIGGGKPISDLVAMNGKTNPLLQFFIGRGAPMLNTAATIGEGLTGTNFAGYEQVDGAFDIFRNYAMDNLPFGLTGIINGDSAMGTVANEGGLRTSPETPPEERGDLINQTIIPHLQQAGIIGKDVTSLDQLGFGESNAVDRWLQQNRPDLVKDYQDFRRQFGSQFQKTQDRRTEIEATYKPEFDQLYQSLITGVKTPTQVFDELTNTRNQLRGQLDELYSQPEYQDALKGLTQNPMQKLANDYQSISDAVAKERGGDNAKYQMTSDDWDEVAKRQTAFMANLTNTDPQLAARFQNDMQQRNSLVDASPIIALKRAVDNDSADYYKLPEKERDAYATSHPLLNVERYVVYGQALKTTEAVDMVLNKQAPGETGKALQAQGFNMPVKLEGYAHRIDQDRARWEQDKNGLKLLASLPPTARDDALKIPIVDAALMYWSGSANLVHDKDTFTYLDARMQAEHWAPWDTVKPAVQAYLSIPNSASKTSLDKPHILAAAPKLDAYVNYWKYFQFGQEPTFKTQEAKTEFHKLTGMDVSKYAVVPVKD